MGHGLKGGEGALSCQDRLVFARAVGLVWGPRGCIPSRRFNNSWEQLRSHAAESGIYFQRHSGFSTKDRTCVAGEEHLPCSLRASTPKIAPVWLGKSICHAQQVSATHGVQVHTACMLAMG